MAVPVPDSPVLVTGVRSAWWLAPGNSPDVMEIEEIGLGDAASRVREGSPPILCHRRAVTRRLGTQPFAAYDLLELFAFVRPAVFCLPTPAGLARALGLEPPTTLEQEAWTLNAAARQILSELTTPELAADPEAAAVARSMTEGGWLWGRYVLAALDHGASENDSEETAHGAAGLAVWRDLPEWSEHAPEPPPGNVPVEPSEARARLSELLGPHAEARPQQSDYASAVSAAFVPRDDPASPALILAEAGTGVGKTLGYIAPASLWAERNHGPVWVSTFTRNLQHQIDGELDRLFPDPAKKARKVVIRKGRENYLCLLNMEEAVGGARVRRQNAISLGLMARWVRHTRDGDMVGGDFPTWLSDLLGQERTLGLTDRRGECIYAACAHYHKCFIERSIRRARRADVVVANHALVMVQAALGGMDDTHVPARYVFDEGHHVFGAADNAFSSHLSGQEMADLRRWVLGAEGRRGSRARGLKRRAGDLVLGDRDGEAAIEAAERAARTLPGESWHQRIAADQPTGAAEGFLTRVRQQLYARARHPDNPYSLETDVHPPVPGLLEAAAGLDTALESLSRPLHTLGERLAELLDDETAELDTPTRLRIEAICRGLRRRGELQIGAWRGMLQALGAEAIPEFVDWFSADRIDGRDVDVGMHRHWIDPTIPFAEHVASTAQGLLITSATLRDGTGDSEIDWAAAEARTGARHLPIPATRAAVLSPFDYAGQTAVLVVTDVRKDDLDQVGAAYRELFIAAGGGCARVVHSDCPTASRLRPYRRATGIGRTYAPGPACRWPRHVDPDRHLPGGRGHLPARNGRRPGWRGRTRPSAPTDRL